MRFSLAGPNHDWAAAGQLGFDEALGWFLEQDIQSNPARCDELLAIVEQLKIHPHMRYQCTGNAHTLSLSGTEALVESDYSEPRVSTIVSLEEFRRAISSWRALVLTKNDCGNRS